MYGTQDWPASEFKPQTENWLDILRFEATQIALADETREQQIARISRLMDEQRKSVSAIEMVKDATLFIHNELSPVAIAGKAQQVVGYMSKLNDVERWLISRMTPTERVQFAEDVMAHAMQRHEMREAAAMQLFILDILQFVHEKFTNKAYMSAGAELTRQTVLRRISGFGKYAHPLTAKEFDAAVKSAWK